MESHAQAGVTIEKRVQCAAQARGVDGAIQFEYQLDEIGILPLAIVVGVEEQSLLQRSERPNVFQIRILPFEALNLRLIEVHQLQITGRETPHPLLRRVEYKSFECRIPEVGEPVDFGFSEESGREAPGSKEDGA